MKKVLKTFAIVLGVVLVVVLMLKGLGTQVPSGSWAPTADLGEARMGASSVMLEDGRILIAGGMGLNGALTSAELYSNSGTIASAAPMNTARSEHALVRLKTGKVLVCGGVTSGDGITNAAEVYDPTSNQWAVISAMSEARAGHTATLMKDGRVLIVGGINSGSVSNTIEIFDPAADSFMVAGILATPRKEHAAALLPDDNVLIAGGASSEAILATTEIFDVTTETLSPGPNLSTPRAGLTATALMNGKILLAGGFDGTNDLATAEVFLPSAYSVAPAGSMGIPRRNHQAFLLPNNNAVLLVGGTAAGSLVSTAELFLPWNSAFIPTGAPLIARQQFTGIPLSMDGLLLMTGGTNGSVKLASSELYGFATIKTDRDDYAPGEIVTITGSGWEPGEPVTLLLHEVNNPDPHEDQVLSAVADSWGRIINTEFYPESHDAGIRFYLTASGIHSQAQTTFTDSVTDVTMTSPTSATPITITSLPATVTISFDYITSTSGTTTGQADVLSVASNTKSLTPGTHSDSIVVTIPAGTANGSYNAKITVTNSTGSGANNKNDGENNSVIVNVPAIAATTLSVASASGIYGGTTTLSATLTKTADNSAVSGKTVSFTLNGSPVGSAVTNASGVATLNSVSLTGISAATYPTGVAGSFAADASFAASSGTAQLTVSKSNTTTAVSSSANPSVFGQSVTFTATVSPVAPGAGTRTGTVTFRDGATVLGTGTVNASGQATFSTSSLSVNAHSITAEYGADTNFNGSTSSALSQTVSKASTSTSVASSLNPSIYGQSVTFTATVNPVAPGAGTRTGTVTFKDGATVLGTGTLNASGQATFSTSALSVSAHSITAEYGGDGNFNTSTSSALNQTVNKADTTTSLTSSVNPSVYGESVTFTATVNPVAPGAGTRTGTVTFKDGATVLGTGTVNASGQATFSISSLSVNSHPITAEYGGDTNFSASTSSALNQIVNRADTATSVSSSANPSVYGQSITFTATVSAVAPGSGISTGTVTFKDGATVLGTGTLNASGQATFSTSTLSISSHSITADYSGDTNFNSSTSSILNQTVTKADTTTTVSSSANPSVFGQSVTFTATVSPVAPGAGTRTGTVTFKGGATVLGTGAVNASGQATFSISSLSVNSHPITAEYGGDDNFNASASGMLSQVVKLRATMTTLALAPSLTPQEGQISTATVTVADTDVLPNFSPTGIIVISSSVPSKAFINGACSLLPTSPGISACSVQITGLDDGVQTITATFSATTIHMTSTHSETLTVSNAAPTITSINGPPNPLAISAATVNITANFTDAGSQDTHQCTFSWDDPTPATQVTAAGTGNGSCTATHTYTATGVYAVGVTVTDDDSGTVSSVFEYVVIYDPSGGFVTGGGFIMSPAGAYVPNPSLTGKANFGFVSKYLKGATKPTGETEFQFQVGNLNFHSSSYDWLVISGAKAQYKGTGTINNAGDYGFLLTATDGQLNGGGGVDKFRIKIWDKASSQIIYDNVPTASDDLDTANPMALSGGSIVIHK